MLAPLPNRSLFQECYLQICTRSILFSKCIYVLLCVCCTSRVYFRPPGPAAAGRAGLYILLLCFLYFFIFFARTYRWASANQATAVTAPTVVLLIKYRQTSDACCSPFYRGAKCAKFWPKFRRQSSSDRRIFEPGRFIGKRNQTCQGPMIGLPSYQTWGGCVPPNSQNRWRNGYPKG